MSKHMTTSERFYLKFMEPCIARCVFYITNEMQPINVLYYYQRSTCFGRLSAHHQELINLYVHPHQPSGRQQESMTIL